MQNMRRLVIVEDEPLISLMIEEIATDLGWHTEGCAYTESEALTLLKACAPTLALLDINLGSTTSLKVAEACRARGIPIVFTTGYMVRDIPTECGGAPILAKPFSQDDLEIAFARATGMSVLQAAC
ncbi:response regulator [uncultured Devosia sp.]|uniref:response regulator n=1 Tax=uncultured Devosia sp. TaxID=211434 RepID=UPI0035C94D13